MPNHILNELIFRNVDTAKQEEIISKLCTTYDEPNDNGENVRVDFEVLLPIPAHIHRGSFTIGDPNIGETWYDWCPQYWGTKWNAYSHRPIQRTDDSITFIFETAWSPPGPWLQAVLDELKLPFQLNWLDEGSRWGHTWIVDETGTVKKTKATEEDQRRIHKLHWGVEEFGTEEEEEPVHSQ